MARINFPHIPLRPAVGDEEILCEGRECLVVVRVDVDAAVLVLLDPVVDGAGGRVEGVNGLGVDLLRRLGG